MDQTILKPEEQAIFALRSLYRSYGYLPFKMTKFEEYDLYVQNKDFLVSDSIITFNGTDGRLLALKPDVTLSIIKNFREEAGCVEKVYYNENVYRLSSGKSEYKEIPQTGLECIGNIDMYQIFEVIALAAQSMETLGTSWVLDLSHMGIISAFLTEAEADIKAAKEIIRCLGEKNRHEMQSICKENKICDDVSEKLQKLSEIYGGISSVLPQLTEICTGDIAKRALGELEALCSLLNNTPFSDRINLDFSIANDTNYYNGFVFRGYLSGIPEGVLSGGQYDRIMEKFGKNAGGIGFAVYLDLLERYKENNQAFDVDILLLYDGDSEKADIFKVAEKLRKDGNCVLASPEIPSKITYKKVCKLQDGRLCNVG